MTTIKIVRKFLTPDELSNPNQRYNADCDCVQTSYDGGSTWTDTPGADPRHFVGNLYPPTAGEDPQCLSAGNMTDRIKFILDTFIESATIFQATTSVLNVLILLLPGAGILIDLVLAVAEALFDIGLVTVDAALTSGVYDQLACILYCAIGSDGQVTPDQFATIRSRVDSEIGGVAAVAIDYALDQLGEVGLANAGTIGESTRDCSGCDCSSCYTWLFEDYDGGWVPYISRGSWVSTQGWIAVIQGSGAYIEVVYTFPSAIHLTNMQAAYAENCGFNPTGSGTWIAYTDGTGEHMINGFDNSCGDPLNFNYDVGADGVTAIAFRMEQNSPTSLVGTRLKQVTITGTWVDEPTGGQTC